MTAEEAVPRRSVDSLLQNFQDPTMQVPLSGINEVFVFRLTPLLC